jgi:predicted ATPase
MTDQDNIAKMPMEADMINRIRIQNFRSIVDVTVDLEPLTVLIGRSGTGKSNFVEAVRFLRDSLIGRQMNARGLGGVHRALHVDHQHEPLGYKVRFSIVGRGTAFEYALRVNVATSEVLDESLKLDEKPLFHQADGKWAHPPEVLQKSPPSGIMLGAIRGLQESTFAYAALCSHIGCYDFPGDVLTGAGKAGPPPDQGFADRGDNYLLVAESIFTDWSKAQSWKQIAKSIQAVNRSASGLTLNAPNPDRLDIDYDFNGTLLAFDVRQESEGLRRFLAQMLAMYQNPSKQTLLFEHPEAALHPGALESLAYEFKECPRDSRGQVILTTHSPQLLDYFPAESLRVVDVKKLETRIGPVAPEQMASLRDHLLRPGELLTVDPARLEGDLAEVPE